MGESVKQGIDPNWAFSSDTLGELLPSQRLLGLMLADPAACMLALETCPPALLRDQFHERIFAAIGSLMNANTPIDAANVKHILKNDAAWKEMPADYIHRLRAARPVSDGVEELVEQLRNQTGVDGRTIYNIRSISELSSLTPPRYLLKGIINTGELSVVFGEPGSGKSFLASWLAYRISLGLPTFDRRVRAAPVLFAALEGEIGFARRLMALKNEYGEASDFHWITQRVDLYDSEANIGGLIDAVLNTKSELLIVDTLARAFGNGNENEGRDMGIVIDALGSVCRYTGAHVMVIHHPGKDGTRGARGHSSLKGSADWEIEVRRPAQGSRIAHVKKAKDGPDDFELGFDLRVVELGLDEDGDPITTCLVVPSEQDPVPRKPKLAGQAKIAFDLLVRAIDDTQTLLPSGPNYPRDKHGVPLTLWRDYCYKGFGSDRDNPGTSRKAFNRARKDLLSHRHIMVWEDVVWLP